MDDLIAQTDEHLPGRAAAEEAALEPLRVRVRRARKDLDDARSRSIDPQASLTVRERRHERLEEQAEQLEQAIDSAEAALVAKCGELATTRRRALPADARNIEVGGGGDDYSEHRYKVTCEVGGVGQLVSLGACGALGDALARAEWYRRELARRKAVRLYHHATQEEGERIDRDGFRDPPNDAPGIRFTTDWRHGPTGSRFFPIVLTEDDAAHCKHAPDGAWYLSAAMATRLVRAFDGEVKR